MNIIFIGGAMGVGKSTVSRILLQSLPDCVWLDGDWCRNDHPFKVNDVTKSVILDNICHCLNNFLACGQYRNIIFSWVMHEQGIIDGIMSRLDLRGARVINLSLVCTAEVLAERIGRDISRGERLPDVIPRALARLGCYDLLDTIKVDASGSPEEVADSIKMLL
ncbi:MAG TPA: AAA family ATPase [Candidatus Coproplasma avicola]|uniref:AAA family ATPase n=1 Tax=Candidatus Coproplasma avicola TaxID=2840744 RepID=A0A9D1E5A4_9FIRM|nr:AAA family ATPase [Candidatus Coproplasma avicola]